MADPFVTAFTITLGIATMPASTVGDPGPDPSCPNDMRLVTGTHFEDVEHYCLDPRKDTRDTHCYAYAEGISALFGATSDISVCMDQFEAPNKKGTDPYVMQSYKGGKKWCEERGKRMCSEQEWETACEGPDFRALSYGWSVDKKICNSDKQWRKVDFDVFNKGGKPAEEESRRLWQGAPSGRYVDCVSPFGIFDMQGNVEEWVTSRTTRKFPGSLMGGFWAKPWTGCRGTNDAHQPSFMFYETGFRCCAEPGTLDADGKRVKK